MIGIKSIQLVGNGKIEIRLDSLAGSLLGEVSYKEREMQNKSNLVSCDMNPLTGRRDVYLVFSGDAETRFNLDWFRFSE